MSAFTAVTTGSIAPRTLRFGEMYTTPDSDARLFKLEPWTVTNWAWISGISDLRVAPSAVRSEVAADLLNWTMTSTGFEGSIFWRLGAILAAISAWGLIPATEAVPDAGSCWEAGSSLPPARGAFGRTPLPLAGLIDWVANALFWRASVRRASAEALFNGYLL